MKPVDDWRAVLRHAWSIRLLIILALLSGLEVAVSLIDADTLGWPRWVFASVAGVISAGAIVARIISQQAFRRDESGRVRPKVMAGAGVAAVVALAASIIAPWEGRELRAYQDIVGVWTICYGETRGVQAGDTATAAECQSMLAKGVADFEVGIRPCLPAALPTETRAAFVSAAYNIGTGAFCGSSMSRRALAGDLRGACDALTLWNKAGGKVVRGLTNRRAAERELCLQGLR